MKRLPTGISNLKMIVESGMVYVDKTDYVHRLAEFPGRYFLSRPRRFGKSLLVDTLKELFEANEPLFRGLAVHDRWDWSRRFPVIKIDWASGGLRSREDLNVRATRIFRRNAERLGLDFNTDTDVSGMLESLVSGAEAKYGESVVLLVDEYDKPMLDNIVDTERATEMRDALRDFYSPIKELDAKIQFVLLTGVSKFSKVNIFSGINNLSDITLDQRYATVCGYTEGELDRYFGEHLEGVDRDKLQEWYNGYNFLGDRVYNPFNILLFIDKQRTYQNYWFETGTPTFLIELLKRHRYFLPELDGIEAGQSLLDSFEVGSMEPATLLFQTGYLTIGSVSDRRGRPVYSLVFPNAEVRLSFSEHLASSFTGLTIERERYADGLWTALTKGDLPALEATIRRLFSSIAWENYRNNPIAEFEGYYASVLYAFFGAVNCRTIPEDVTNHGQVDLTLMIGDFVYVIEIKVIGKPVAVGDEGTEGRSDASGVQRARSPAAAVEEDSAASAAARSDSAVAGSESRPDDAGPLDVPTNPALAQIQARGYAEKYVGGGATVFEVGLVFDRAERNLVRFDFARSTVG